MKAITHSIFKTFLVSVCIVANVHFAYAVDQSIIPPAYTTFLDSNGNPLSSGKVFSYVPSTTTAKTTYQNFGGTIANTNPVILNAAGRAKIWGTGQYRQIVKDKNDNIIWDADTSAAGSGSSTPTATGDGDLVGTIKPWAGMTAPNQYAFTYGQEVSRTTYSVLYTAITSTQAVFCNSGSPTLSGLSDTTNFWVGMSLEVSCVAAGFTTVNAKTSSTITMATNANVTTNTNATFFPWGRGNGTTTFNLPDYRGAVPIGNNIMGGVAGSLMSIAYFSGANPDSSGALGGNQSTTLGLTNLPIGITSTVTTTNDAPNTILRGSVAGTATTFGNGGSTFLGGWIQTATLTSGSVTSTGTATSNNTGSGGSPVPFSRVQPSRTTNFIIKITPDTNSATASGVTSLGGMTGDIACGTNITCTGNTISASGGALAGLTGQMAWYASSGTVVSGSEVVIIGCGVACAIGRTNNLNVYAYPNSASPVALFNGVQLGSGTGAGNGEGGSVTFWTKNPTGSGAPNTNQELGFMQAYAETGAGINAGAPVALVFITTEAWSTIAQGAGNLFQATTRGQTTARGEACIAEGLTVAFMSGSCTIGLGIGTINSGAGTYDTGNRVLSASNTTLTINQNAPTNLNIANSSTGTSAFAGTGAANSANSALFGIGGTGYTGQGSLLQNKGFIYTSTGSAGIILYADGASHSVDVATNGTTRTSTLLGFMVGTSTDPGAGIINVATGFRVANTATSGNVLRGNGTNFVSAQLACSDLSGAGSGCSSAAGITALTGDVTASGSGSVAATLATAQPGAHTWALGQTFSSAITYGGVTLSNSVTGTGSMALSISPTFTGTLSSANHTITSASANALAVGPNGTTNPSLQVDASTASAANGIKITPSGAGSGLLISTISSTTNEPLGINSKGSGVLFLNNTATGGVSIGVGGGGATIASALTYGGVTLSNSVTGTGSMVLSTNAALTTPNLGTPSALVCTNCTGTASGLTAGTATNAVNTGITDDTTTNASMLLTWVTTSTGNLPQKVSSTKLSFNPSTGILSSTSFTGAGTGLTGTGASFTAGSATTTNQINSVDQTTAWTTYSPTISCTVGSPGAVTATGRSKTLGKTIFVEVNISAFAIGTCSNAIKASLPVNAAANNYMMTALDTSTAATLGAAILGATDATTMRIFTVAGLFPTGSTPAISGVYEAN